MGYFACGEKGNKIRESVVFTVKKFIFCKYKV